MVSELQEGKEYTLKGFVVNGNASIISKIKSMGLREGKKVKVLMKNGRVYLLKLDNTRLVLDKKVLSYLKLED